MTHHKESSSSGPPWKPLVVVGVVLLAMSAAIYHRAGQPGGDKGPNSSTRSRSVPPYYSDLRGVVLPRRLPPERFPEGKARYAYQVAASLPATLAQLPCYCPCDRVGHKSLLDCYADEHGAYCDICQDSALWADKRMRENATLSTIRQELVSRYSTTP